LGFLAGMFLFWRVYCPENSTAFYKYTVQLKAGQVRPNAGSLL
jgi:hypothetical protein